MTQILVKDAYYRDIRHQKRYSNEKHISDEDVQIDAVYYDTKNTTSAIYGTSTNSSLTRFNIDYEKLNTLGWSEAGAEITYKFNAPKTGNIRLLQVTENQYNNIIMFSGTKKVEEDISIESLLVFE